MVGEEQWDVTKSPAREPSSLLYLDSISCWLLPTHPLLLPGETEAHHMDSFLKDSLRVKGMVEALNSHLTETVVSLTLSVPSISLSSLWLVLGEKWG